MAKSKAIVSALVLGTTLASGAAQAGNSALQAGDFLVRLRAIDVDTEKVYKSVNGIPGADAEAHHDETGEIDFTYMITPNWGLELIAATTNHDLHGHNLLDTLGIEHVGEADVLPPTLTLQYHFNQFDYFRPYVGVGINYTHFYDESAGSDLESAAAGGPGTDIELDDSWGYSLQAGLDMHFNKDWFFNFDVKYIDITTELEIKPTTGALAAVLAGTSKDVDLDPVVFGVGIGRRF